MTGWTLILRALLILKGDGNSNEIGKGNGNDNDNNNDNNNCNDRLEKLIRICFVCIMFVFQTRQSITHRNKESVSPKDRPIASCLQFRLVVA